MMIAAVALFAGSILLQNPPEVLAPQAGLDTLTLVRSSEHKAVVRVDDGKEILVLEIGSRIGRTAAVVKEIEPGRLVLEELTRDKDGRPRRAQVVFREGEKGGRRLTRDPGTNPPTGVRPQVLGPDGKPLPIKKSGKL